MDEILNYIIGYATQGSLTNNKWEQVVIEARKHLLSGTPADKIKFIQSQLYKEVK